MSDVSGSLRKVTLDGVTFDVMADSNISEVGSSTENEMVPSSGRAMLKKTRRIQMREGLVIACNDAERELLEERADRTIDFPMSYETASGSIYRATGIIEFENRETEENRAAIKLLPRTNWTAFVAA